jgi:hypothetical protein
VDVFSICNDKEKSLSYDLKMANVAMGLCIGSHMHDLRRGEKELSKQHKSSMGNKGDKTLPLVMETIAAGSLEVGGSYKWYSGLTSISKSSAFCFSRSSLPQDIQDGSPCDSSGSSFFTLDFSMSTAATRQVWYLNGLPKPKLLLFSRAGQGNLLAPPTKGR